MTLLGYNNLNGRPASQHEAIKRADYYHQFHLDLLREWNEEYQISVLTGATLYDDYGVTVVQTCQEWSPRFDKDGTFKGLDKTGVCHVTAIYGDEDLLKKLVVLSNEGKANVLIDEVIRS